MLYTCVQLFLFTLVLRYSSKQRIMSGSASTLLILNLLIHSDSLTDLPLNICERVTISVFTALVIVMKVTATSILVVLAMRVTITVFSADGIIIIIPSALNTVMVTLIANTTRMEVAVTFITITRAVNTDMVTLSQMFNGKSVRESL